MARVLLINPNTTATVTARLAPVLADELGGEHELACATARFGADYISSEAAYCIAGHATLDALASAGAGARGVLIGCFGDPGVFALREVFDGPVIGLAEAAMREAAALGPFAIVTGGARWQPMLERLAQSLGLDSALQRIELVDRTGAQLAADPAAALQVLGAACSAAARGTGVRSVILGGAALVGMAQALQSRVELPLIDNVRAGGRMMRRALADRVAPGPGADGAGYSGVSAELARLMSGQGSITSG
ncbi:MAG: aspartate/glutamate racemase family protein [Burkholderiales bacterium]|nr:aspartate/glutamate racemase family protein [Burkholderiales bacterium]